MHFAKAAILKINKKSTLGRSKVDARSMQKYALCGSKSAFGKIAQMRKKHNESTGVNACFSLSRPRARKDGQKIGRRSPLRETKAEKKMAVDPPLGAAKVSPRPSFCASCTY